jgi:hypothetical protein
LLPSTGLETLTSVTRMGNFEQHQSCLADIA